MSSNFDTFALVNLSAANLTPKQLRQAANLKEQISRLESRLESMLSGSSAGTVRRSRGGKGKRKMSAEARAKISAAQKKRWAARKRKQGG